VRSARPSSRNLFGLLLLDKPSGMSSNHALQRAKRLFQASKAGHGGSLDPLATGMLPIFFGSATKLAAYLLEARKTYAVTARLGIATSTGDAEGTVTADRSAEPAPELAAIEAAVARHTGEILQVPPMFSALKRGGVPLYRFARAGQEVAREPRRVVIEELRIDGYRWPELELTVRCSKGTYVRTLVEDIAAAAGTVGHVTALRRLTVEPFQDQAMHSFATLEAAEAEGVAALDRLLLSPNVALAGWPIATVDSAAAARLASGRAIPAEPHLDIGRVRVEGLSGELIALGQVTADRQLAPTRVFIR
jgi:tRNA pseudouridine55 synthase